MALPILRFCAPALHRNVRCSARLLLSPAQSLDHERPFILSRKVFAEDVGAESSAKSERIVDAGHSLYEELSSLGSVENALEVISKRELSGNEASIAVRALRRVQKSDSSSVDFAADKRFISLAASIIKGVKNLSNDSLTSSLANSFHVNSNYDDFILALEGECRRRLRLLPIRSVATIVCNDQLLSRRTETKALVKEAARVLELRWRELQNPQIVRRLLPSAARVSEPLLERVEDKVLEMLSQFSFQELVGLMKTLLVSNTRSLPILRAISYQLLEQRAQWEISPMLDIMSSMGNMGFHNAALFSEFAAHIQEKLDESSLSLLCDIAKTYAVLRVESSSLMDSIHNVATGAVDELNTLDLKRLLFAYSQFTYQPADACTFYEKVERKLHATFNDYSLKDQIDIAHSLMVLKTVFPQILEKVLRGSNETKDLSPHSTLKLLQINTHVQLDYPEYKGPFLSSDFKQFPADYKIYPSTLHRSLIKVLQASLGQEFSMLDNVKTDLGYVIDAEVFSSVEGNGPKLAIMTFSPPCYLYSTRQLIGRLELMLSHLELAGYQVLQIPYHDWYPLRTPVQQVNYLKDKLKERLE